MSLSLTRFVCLLTLLGGFTIATAAQQTLSENAERPNVVLIHVDDMGPEHLASYGGNVLTPRIDSLGEDGVRLTRYYAVSAVCSPSRYNLLTGRYASRCVDFKKQFHDRSQPAFIRWNAFLEGEEETIAHLMGEAGYATALIGKHHNTRNEQLQTNRPKDADPRSASEIKRMRENYQNNVEAVRDSTGFQVVDRLFVNNLHTLEIDESLEQHNPEWITEGALEFIHNHKSDPFFLYLAHTVPHGPSPLESMKSDPRITPSGFLEVGPATKQASRENVFSRVAAAGLPESAAPLTWLDDSVGAVLDTLEEEGLAENTIVVFISDHSGKGKLTCYDDGARTPGFIRWPSGVAGGRTIDALTASIDWTPTILEACGVYADSEYKIDGSSVLPLLRGETEILHESLMLEIAFTKGVVTRDWKYIATRFPDRIQKNITPENRNLFNHEGEKATWDAIQGVVSVRYGTDKRHLGLFDDDQLYSLVDDPGEAQNLAYAVDHAKTLELMQRLLRSYTREFPHRFGEY